METHTEFRGMVLSDHVPVGLRLHVKRELVEGLETLEFSQGRLAEQLTYDM